MTASALDAISTAQGSSAAPSSGNLTTTQANELAFAAGSTSDPETWSAGSGFTMRQTAGSKIATEDKMLSSTQTLAGTFSLGASDGWTALLATFKAADAHFSYVYDRFGNRWQQNGPNSMQLTFTGNSPGNPQNNNRMDGYSYDAAGNLLNDGTHNYFYNAENQLIQVDGSAGYCYSGTGTAATACYLYDAFGRRVYRRPDPATCDSTYHITNTIYDLSDRPIVNGSGANGNACTTEIYAGSRHLANQGGGIYFAHSDWLGTLRLETPVMYSLTVNPWYFRYCSGLPFGESLGCHNGSGVANSPQDLLRFTGKPHDQETNLDYFGARFDSSSFGRFMSPDDTDTEDHADDPQGLNLYAYVQDNPTNATDPDGHDCVFTMGNSAYVVAGTCSGLPDGAQNATYVAGTINRGSATYDSDTGTLRLTYTPYSQDAGGSGAGIGRFTMSGLQPTHPGLTEFEKFVGRMSIGADQLNYLTKQVALQALGRVQGVVVSAAVGALFARLAPAGAQFLASRPAWATTAGGFVNWLKNLSKSGAKLSPEELDAVADECKTLGIKAVQDPPHPNTNWNVPHWNIGNNGRVHLEIPAGYSNPNVPLRP